MFISLITLLVVLKNSFDELRRGRNSPTRTRTIAAAATTKKSTKTAPTSTPTTTTLQYYREYESIITIAATTTTAARTTTTNKEITIENHKKEEISERRNNSRHLKKCQIANNMSNFPTQQQQQSQQSSAGDDAIDGHVASQNTIIYKPGDKQCCHEILERNVKVICSAGTHDHGSSKVKLKNIVDYKWENKNYPGHLIAVHIDGKHIAYVINVNNKVSRMEGMIRVVNAQSGLRALIKGMSGEVLDLQFAHIEKERILASIDVNSLYVHKIDMLDGTLLCNVIIKVEDPLLNYTPKYDKISWCPYIQVPEETDEDSQLIVWARGSIFQCFNVNEIVNEHGIGVIHTKSLTTGYLKFQDDCLTISWVALSPDGSTLGVGSTDGVIRFYQVYMHDKEPRCLHQWKPHNGKPVSSFFFLDNLTKEGADTYWKYAITGAANNTEFKVWDCGTWECLQTVNMLAASEDKKPPRFIAEIDRTAGYLVLTSLEIRTCYVMQICNGSASLVKEGDSGDDIGKDTSSSSGSGVIGNVALQLKRNSLKMPLVYIKSIAEFPLSSGILSFSIVDAAVRRYKCANDNYLCEELDDYDEETNSIYCVVLRMFIVQSKSMQECRILYQPTVTESVDVKSSISSDNSNAVNATKESTSSLEGSVAGSGGIPTHGSNIKSSSNGQPGDDDEDDDVTDDLEIGINALKQEQPAELIDKNALEALLGIGNGNSQITVQTTTTTSSSSVVALGTVSDVAKEHVKSRTASPQVSAANSSSSSGGGKAFTQVNLMTPDAFSSSGTTNKKTPDCVSSEVLNTILMLASVAGQGANAPKSDNMNLLNLVNNTIIEGQEHQKMQKNQTHETQKKFISIESSSDRNATDNLASGGSSPSREVQEILSLHDYDKSSYSGDELLEEQPVKTVSDATSTVSSNVIDVTVADLDAVASQSQASTSSSWPKVPDVHKVAATKHSDELQNAANLISQAVNASSAANNLNSSHVAAPTLSSSVANGAHNGNGNGNGNALLTNNSNNNNGSNNNGNGANVSTGSSDITELNMKIDQLIELVKVQSMHINTLQNEIADMKKCNPMNSPKAMSEFSFKLEMQLSKLMEQYLKRYENEHKKKLTAFMGGRDLQNREMRDSFMQIINQYVLTKFGEVVSKVITIEIQRQLAPLLTAKIDQLQQQIQLDVAQKLAAFDLMLKENIAQVCKSKNIIDAFGKSVLVGVQGSLQAAFIESMSSTLIPAYEKSSQNMFKQLHEAFSVGIKEFMEQFDSYLQHLQPMHDSTEEILTKFSGFRQQLDAVLSKHRNAVTETMMETRKDVKGLEILLSRQVQETIRLELRKYLENQSVAMRSQTTTPAPIYDLKDAIKLLLHQGQINKAFHQALLANDLNLVEFILKHADQNAVFTPSCCLEQKVLLSLIQQISADMSNHNEVKQNYLAEALLAINPHDPITREHAPKVLQELFRNCQMFLMNYPKSGQCSNVRMLMKAVEAYKDQF